MDIWTHGRIYGRTDIQLDRPSCRDARTHLKRTSLTKIRHEMRFGNLFTLLSPSSPLNNAHIDAFSRCSFVKIQPEKRVFRKFNCCAMDGRTDGLNYTLCMSLRDARRRRKKRSMENDLGSRRPLRGGRSPLWYENGVALWAKIEKKHR